MAKTGDRGSYPYSPSLHPLLSVVSADLPVLLIHSLVPLPAMGTGQSAGGAPG